MSTESQTKKCSYEEWARDVLALAPDDRRKFIRKSLRSKRMLHVFGRFFFPHLIRGENDEVPEAHIALIDALASPDSSGVIFPRGFAKSTWEKIDTIHDMVYGLEPVIVYIGATKDDVEQHFEGIKGELETNVELRRYYGDLVPQIGKPGTKWNGRHIRARNGVTLIGRGAGKGRGVNINGRRPTKVVVDDGETDEMVRSSKRRDKYWKWLTEVIVPSLDKERGRLKVIGTVIHPRCAALRFYEEKGGLFRKAIEDGKSIWPEYWTLESLLRIRDGYITEDGRRVMGIGTRAFSQEYLNTPVGEGLTMFRQAWLDDNAYQKHPPVERMDIVMAVDPAAGEGSTADDYGMCVIGRSRDDGRRYVLESGLYHGGIGTATQDATGATTYSGARKWFNDAYRRWEPQIAGIEASMTVQAFWQVTRDSGLYRLTKLRPSAGRGGSNASKEERAKLVEPHVEGGMIKFSPKQTDLYDQMLAFPSADVKDDVFDAFLHANAMLDGEGATIKTEVAKTVTGTSRLRTKQF